MNTVFCTQVFGEILVLLVQLVVTSGTEGTQRPCPPGQIIHPDGRGRVRCCLPVHCGLNHFVKFCPYNGTRDVCEQCPRKFALFKRTSSFAYETCQVFPLVPNNCSELPGNPKATAEDIMHCFCELEMGVYYMKPQVPLGRSSYCQPFHTTCRKGEQPTLKGVCEPCPRNTVQDVDDNFFLCRPQTNCTALGLETEEMGNTQKETVCAKPPSLPSYRPPVSAHTTTASVLPGKATTKKTTVVSVKEPVPPSVAPVLDSEDGAYFTVTHIVVLCVSGGVLLILIIVIMIYVRRKGYCAPRNSCHRHCAMESAQYPVNSQPCDNDNASDDSCCACADSCLASSSKSSNSGKGGACAIPPCKQPGHVPMLEGYMNGKCGHGELSEPLYNSISHDESKLSQGNLATYQNLNGVPPTMLKQGDFVGKAPPAFDYSYPSKVRIPSMDSEEDSDSLKKGHHHDLATPDPGKGKEAKDREDFTETDPLLPNLEVVSCGSNPPTGARPLRGILRHGNARQEASAAQGDGREVGGGNRPNLSMLLSSVESMGASQESGGRNPVANLPYLSQLVSSSPHSTAQGAVSPPQQPPVQHQQLQQQPQAAPEPPQHVHELPPQLQRRLMQQQQQQQQQQPQQEGSTLALRLIPTAGATQPPVNTSLVQMDELKPALSLHPSPTTPPPPPNTTTTTTVPTGAANIRDRKERTASPARINPSQQKQVRGGPGGKGREEESSPHAVKAPDTKLAAEEMAIDPEGAGPGRRLDEETLRKEALPAASPVEEEETTRKSVGGSSGLGDSLDLSSPLSLPSEDGRRSRSLYRRSNSEASRSVSPQLPLPPSRSISSPGDKNRPYAVVKPMQSDQSLDALSSSPDQLTELTRPLDSASHQYPLQSLRSSTPERESSQESSEEADEAENA